MRNDAGRSPPIATAIADPAPPAPSSITRLPANEIALRRNASTQPSPSKMSARQRPSAPLASALIAPTTRACSPSVSANAHARTLYGNREHEAAQVLQPQQLRQDRVEIFGQHVQRDEDRVAAAAAKLRREHFRRADLLDRMSDDAEYARLAGNVVDFVLNLHGMFVGGGECRRSPDDGAAALASWQAAARAARLRA